MSGAFNAINLASTVDNIELINAGAVSSLSGGAGIVTTAGTGSTDILDSANVSASKAAISAQTAGSGTLCRGADFDECERVRRMQSETSNAAPAASLNVENRDSE